MDQLSQLVVVKGSLTTNLVALFRLETWLIPANESRSKTLNDFKTKSQPEVRDLLCGHFLYFIMGLLRWSY